jgi:hypothetical protein
MLFVGLDLHKKYTEYAVMDIAGNVQRQGKVENTLDKMREFSESVPSKSSMIIESSSTWYWAHRLLSERHDVMLSNPIRNKAIASAKVKTDKIDSITLANLLRGGWAAECYVPSKDTMELRELVRFRANLVRESPHPVRARRDGGTVLRQDHEEEGGPEGHRGSVGETAQDHVLGPEGEEGVSQLRGVAATTALRARASTA